MLGRFQARLAVVALSLILAIAGCASPTPSKLQAFVTQDRRIVVEPGLVRENETILRLENDNGHRHQLMLVRLEPNQQPDRLPMIEGIVPAGSASKLHHDGDGYTVLTKGDRMAAYFNGPQRVRQTMHEYLRAGRYVLLCNLPGHYEAGEWAEIVVEAKR